MERALSRSHIEPRHRDQDADKLKSVFSRSFDAVRLAIVMDLRSAVPELAELEAAEIATTRAIFN